MTLDHKLSTTFSQKMCIGSKKIISLISPLTLCFIVFVQHNLPTLNQMTTNDTAKPAKIERSEIFTQHQPPLVNITGSVNCTALFHNDRSAITTAAQQRTGYVKNFMSDEDYTKMTKDCDWFIQSRGYVTHPITSEEADFPISYTIMAYKDAEQTERLLRAIYRPQNHYCIHVDANSTDTFNKAIAGIVNCLSNVFIASPPVDVVWANWSVVEAELVCMRMLLKTTDWKYHINLAAQEFPLKTNLEIVEILKAFNGSNLMEAKIDRLRSYKFRWENSFIGLQKMKPKAPPPIPLQINKGSFLIIARREFVYQVIHNETSKIFAQWLKDTHIPDELFFCTLNHDTTLQYPGGYKGHPQTGDNYPFLNRYIIWEDTKTACHGKYVREVCVFSLGDLPNLYNRPELFLNKLHLREDPITYACMEELHYNKTRDEMAGIFNFDPSYYRQFEFTWNHW